MKTERKFEDEFLYERKNIILNHVIKTPGIRYRELLKLSGFSNGVLSYHLTGLEEAGLVRVERKHARRITRYYPNNISEIESSILSYLRHPPLKEIILFILENHQCNISDIVNYTGKAISTISLHLGYLKQEGIIIPTRRNGQVFLYRLANPDLVAEVASKYNMMKIIDKSIDNFLDMVGKL